MKKTALTKEEKEMKEIEDRQAKTLHTNALMFLTIAKEMDPSLAWKDLVGIYQNLTGNITQRRKISSDSKNIDFNSISSGIFNYFAKYDRILAPLKAQNNFLNEYEEVIEDSDLNVIKRVKEGLIVSTISVPEDQWEELFDIDLKNSSAEEITQKINQKFMDDNFLIKYFKLDPHTEYISEKTFGGWSTPVKVQDEKGKYYLKIHNNSKFSIVIKKLKEPVPDFYNPEILKGHMENYFDEYLKLIKTTRLDFLVPYNKEAFYSKTKKIDNSLDNDKLLVIPGIEMHLNRQNSVLHDENLFIEHAIWRLVKIADDIKKYQEYHKCGNVLFINGGDFWNSELDAMTSSDSNHQDNDRMLKEGNLVGIYMMINLINMVLPTTNKVTIKHGPGNHDEEMALFTQLILHQAFKDNPKVEIEIAPKDLKFTTYHKFGENIFVITHGKTPLGKELKAANNYYDLIKHTVPEKELSEAKNIVVLRGHDHKFSVETMNFKELGFSVMDFPATAGTDRWTSQNNFFGSLAFNKAVFNTKHFMGNEILTFDSEDKQQEAPQLRLKNHEPIDKTVDNLVEKTEDQIKEYNAKKEIRRINRTLNNLRDKHAESIQLIMDEFGIKETYEELPEKTRVTIKQILSFDKEEKRLEDIKEENNVYVLKPKSRINA